MPTVKGLKIVWKCKHFKELTVNEVYAIHRLRNEVFVVEQGFIFQDNDNKDQDSFHLCGWDGETQSLATYARLLPGGVDFIEPSIGRVCTAKSHRGIGLGKVLMLRAIDECDRFENQNIRINAELYLKSFYESLGFEVASAEYDDCGAPHIEMLYHSYIRGSPSVSM